MKKIGIHLIFIGVSLLIIVLLLSYIEPLVQFLFSCTRGGPTGLEGTHCTNESLVPFMLKLQDWTLIASFTVGIFGAMFLIPLIIIGVIMNFIGKGVAYKPSLKQNLKQDYALNSMLLKLPI